MINSHEFSSPHIRSGNSELLVSIDFLIAALPAIIWSVIAYGVRPLAVIIVTMLFAALFEYLFCLVFRKEVHFPIAVLIGMITALFMPAGIDYWILPLAALIGVIARRLTSGIIHPIASSLLPLFLFGSQMTAHTKIFESLSLGVFSYADKMDELAVKLPYSVLLPENSPNITVFDVFLGNSPESIGGMSAILLIIGGVYLLCRRAITWHIPVGYIAGASLVWFLLLFDGAHYDYLIYHLCSGSIFLAAFFGATEYSSSPTVPIGRFIHGAGCSALTMLFRKLGMNAAMSVLLAMAAVSIFSRVIDMITAERYFGYHSQKLHERFAALIPDFKK